MRQTFSILLAIAAFAFAAPNASAQTEVFVGVTTIADGGTNNVAAGATNGVYSTRIDVPRAPEFGLYVSAKPITTNIVTLKILLYGSLDGSTYSTIPSQQFTYTGSTNVSGGVVSLTTNVIAGSVPYFFATVANSEGVAATNFTLKYGPKVGR